MSLQNLITMNVMNKNRVQKIRKRIKLYRMEKGYTQDYVAQQLKISQYAYQKIESGKTQLKVGTFIELARILKVKESYLLNGNDN